MREEGINLNKEDSAH